MLIISSHNSVFRVFQIVIVGLRIISSLAYMSFAAIKHDVEGDYHIHHPDRYYEITLSEDEIRRMDNLELVFESIFFIDMVFNFFKEYQPKLSTQPVRSFEKIALNYMHGQFIYDLIPLIPYSYMFEFRNCRLLYFLKSIRIFKSVEMMSDKVFIKELADYNRKKME